MKAYCHFKYSTNSELCNCNANEKLGNANEKYARNRMRMRQAAFCSFHRFAPRAASQGQKPADAFLHEAGQIRLGKRQAWRQAKIVASSLSKIAKTLAPLGAKCL